MIGLFSVEERDRVRARLLARAEADGAVVGAAFTGSYATGDADRWSDTDLVLGVRGTEVGATLDAWTAWLRDDFGALHHWDLPVGPASVVRVFLLPGWLELDLTFAPEAEFGPRGPQWHTIFGAPRSLPPFAPPRHTTVTGLAWHHALHARVSIERERWWAAEYWIGQLRGHLIELACLRLDLPTAHAKGAHLLPDETSTPLAVTLVRTLTALELRRALHAAVTLFASELAYLDVELAAMLGPALAEIPGVPRDGGGGDGAGGAAAAQPG